MRKTTKILFFTLGSLIFVLFVLPLAIGLAYGFYLFTTHKPSPAEARFKAANAFIKSYDSATVGFGESDELRLMAREFATVMQEVTTKGFSGGHEAILNPTKGHVLVYCHATATATVFLVHIPDLNQYKSDARDKLCEFSWTIAQRVVKEHRIPAKTLAVALRGTVAYGPVLVGTPEGTPRNTPDDLDRLYPFFAPEPPAATRPLP